jgi:hypothetical protein
MYTSADVHYTFHINLSETAIYLYIIVSKQDKNAGTEGLSFVF